MRPDDAIAMNPDYIVVGGGPAGCVMAGRLSEDPSVKVLLIEAGRDSDDARVRIPVGVAMLVGNKKWDWMWETGPDASINGREFTWTAGKTLGGGSAVHGQVHIRGLASDYDEWAEILGGGHDWSHADLLPYFVKAEGYPKANSPHRNANGPLSVADIDDPHPLADAFIDAGVGAGYKRLDSHNGEEAEGFALTQATQRNGRRFTAYDGYIRPHTDRPNLAVLTKTRVLRVRFDGTKATGVDIETDDGTKTVTASREIVISAGAVASANLLMKSGVGRPDVLQAAGVDVVAAREGVGRNLQEHAGVGISKHIDQWSLNSLQRPDRALPKLFDLLVRKRGPFASPVVQAMGFARTNPDLTRPDIQLHFLPFAYVLGPESRSALTADMPKRSSAHIQLTPCKPKTRGEVRITDNDPTSAPTIDHQLIGDPADMQTMIAGLKLINELWESPRLAESVEANLNPVDIPTTDDGWEDYIRRNACVAYHHVGTCSMGRPDDPNAVVDPQLRVIGVEGLRVVDASVMPVVPSSNTYIPTVAVAEKAADLVKAG